MLVSGLLSGIDWEQLVDQLIQVERRPLQQLQSRQKEAESLKSTWSEIESLAVAVRDAARALQDMDLLDQYGVVSSHPEAVTAGVEESVVAGTYEVTVQQLARAHSVASDQFAGPLGVSGTFTLSGDGGSTWVTIDVATGDTLADIAAKVNEAYQSARAGDPAFVGVRATVIDDRLVLTRSETGAQSLKAGGDTALLQAMGILGPDGVTFANELRTGADAQLTINGLALSSSSNQVTAVQGLTIELFEADPARTVTLTVARDREAVEGEINAFITAYNQLVEALSSLTSRGGQMQADSTAVNLLSSLRFRTGGRFDVGGEQSSLSSIGLGTNGTGPSLSLEAESFWQAFDENPAQVRDLLAAAGADLEAYLDAYVESDGILEARTEGLDARIEAMQESIERMEVRLELRRANLMRQYQALESLMAQLTAQGNWLAMQTQSLTTLTHRGSGR